MIDGAKEIILLGSSALTKLDSIAKKTIIKLLNIIGNLIV